MTYLSVGYLPNFTDLPKNFEKFTGKNYFSKPFTELTPILHSRRFGARQRIPQDISIFLKLRQGHSVIQENFKKTTHMIWQALEVTTAAKFRFSYPFARMNACYMVIRWFDGGIGGNDSPSPSSPPHLNYHMLTLRLCRR